MKNVAITKMQAIILAAIIIVAAIAVVFFVFMQPSGIEAPEKIKIGATLSLSGWGAPMARFFKKGYTYAQEYINEKGGIYIKKYDKNLPVEIIIYDDESDPTKSISLYERLITVDKVHVTLGPVTSTMAYAASTVAEDKKIPMVSPSGWSDKLYERGFRYLFCTYVKASTVSAYLIDDLKTLLGDKLKNMAITYEISEYCNYLAIGAQSGALRNGIKIELCEGYPSGTSDFSTLMMKLKAIGEIDLYFTFAYPATNIEIMKALRAYNVNPKTVFVYYGADDPAFLDLKETIDYILMSPYWTWKLYTGEDPEMYNWFMNKLEKEGDPLASDIALSFDGAMILADALKRAGSLDPEAIRDALAETDMASLYGLVKFDNYGVNFKRRPPISQYQSGSYVLLTPVEYAEGNIIYPTPTWKERGLI